MLIQGCFRQCPMPLSAQIRQGVGSGPRYFPDTGNRGHNTKQTPYGPCRRLPVFGSSPETDDLRTCTGKRCTVS
jgi:hypothetical protein